MVDPASPLYNRGRIDYTTAPREVYEAVQAKFSEDMETFLNARGEEIAGGGLLAFIIPRLPDGLPPSLCFLSAIGNIMDSILMDMIHHVRILTKIVLFFFPKFSCVTENVIFSFRYLHHTLLFAR